MCAGCHSLGSHSTGPALGGLDDAWIAGGEGFSYSSALSSRATMKWSDLNLDMWLKNP